MRGTQSPPRPQDLYWLEKIRPSVRALVPACPFPDSPPSPAGTDSAVASRSNPCLDAAKACNLNDNCKKLRSAYISTCNKQVSATEHCSRHKCHKALRHFFDRVPNAYSYRLLFCSCKDQACAERRRQTIVPDCSYQEREKPNCLALRSRCRVEPFCR